MTFTKPKNICLIILIISFLLKMLYAFKVGYNISSHDLSILSTIDKPRYGHLAYIQYLYENRALPITYKGQFYHPPLFHIIGALVCFVLNVTDDYVFAFEVIQQINMVASCIATFYCYLILRKISIDDRFLPYATAFIAFCPAFYIVGTELNNDCFVLLFSIASIYYTICWLKDSTTTNILKIALVIILAVLSKTSGVMVAFAIGIVFLYELYTNKERRIELFKQYCIFGSVCVPLALLWVIRNKIRYDIPFSYVNRLKESSSQYIGDCSLIERIGLPTFESLTLYKTDFTDIQPYNSNIWGQTFSTMNFDEGILNITNVFLWHMAILLLWSSIAFTILLLASVIRNLFSRNISNHHKILFSMNYLIYFGSYILFCFSYPHVCSMNYRYIVITLMLLICSGGLYITESRHRIYSIALKCLVIIQSVIAAILYIVCAV